MAIRSLTNMNFHGKDSATSLRIGQTIKLFYLIIVVPDFIITFHGQICNAVSEAHNTNGTTFESNLNSLFDILVPGGRHKPNWV